LVGGRVHHRGPPPAAAVSGDGWVSCTPLEDLSLDF
jgi:hypothetical protein